MERPQHEDSRRGASHASVAPLAASSAPASSVPVSTRPGAGLFASSAARERARPQPPAPTPSMATFLHQDVEPLRAYPPLAPPSAQPAINPGSSSTATGSSTSTFRSVLPSPPWTAAPLTPRYLTAATAAHTAHPPAALGALLSGPSSSSVAHAPKTNASSTTSSSVPRDHYCSYNTAASSTARTTSTEEPEQQRQQLEAAVAGLSSLTSAAPPENTSHGGGASHYYSYSATTNAAVAPVSSEPIQPQPKVARSSSGHYYSYNGSSSALRAPTTESTHAPTGEILTTETSSATLAGLPLALPLALPRPLPPSSSSTTQQSSRKRKRPSGAVRLRNFLCMHPGCGKSFTDSAHLRDHTVVHTGEKKLSCPECHKKFARPSTLREHRHVHTGEKPYVCVVSGCEKRYSSRAALRFHSSTHTSIIPLVSSVAQTVGAAMPASTSGHEATTFGLPFLCQECGKRFRVRELLMAHRKVHDTHRNNSLAVTLRIPPAIAVPSRPGASTVVVESPAVIEEHSTPANALPTLPPAPHPRRHLEETIRTQQDQIARLQAEVQMLRSQQGMRDGSLDTPTLSSRESRHSRDTAATSATDPSNAVPTTPQAITAPVELLQDGVKPFQCCICHQRFTNFYQLSFHGKHHLTASASEVAGGQAPLPVGPKYCPEPACEYAEAGGKSLRNLQTLKRHWQRRHQKDRPYTCSHCPPTHQKTFKTRENLKAHEKDCIRSPIVR